MGSKPAIMKEKVKMVHKVRTTGQKVVRVKRIVNGHGTLSWMSEDGKFWPGGLVVLVPDVKEQA